MARSRVEQLMTRAVVTAREDTRFLDLVETLSANDVSSLPVVDGDSRLIGIVSEADLLSKEAHGPSHRPRLLTLLAGVRGRHAGEWLRKAEGRTAGSLMTADVVTASPDEPARDAALRMIRKGLKHLPVTEDGVLVGILSRVDVLRVFERTDAELESAVSELLGRCFNAPPDAQIDIEVRDGVVTLSGIVPFEGDVSVVKGLVAGMDGVVGVEARLGFREPEHTMPLV